MGKTITLSRTGLVEKLRAYDGKQFWSVRTVTVPELLKKGRNSKRTFEESFGFPAYRVRKVCEMVIGLGYDYGTVVIHRLAKADKSESMFKRGESEQTWHCPAFPDSDIIRKNKKDTDASGQLYVAVNCIANNPPKVEYIDIEFGSGIILHRMVEVEEPDSMGELVKVEKDFGLSEFLKKSTPPQNQGLDNPVEYRVFKVEGIERLTCNGITYQITDV